jgi:hypothetical protein
MRMFWAPHSCADAALAGLLSTIPIREWQQGVSQLPAAASTRARLLRQISLRECTLLSVNMSSQPHCLPVGQRPASKPGINTARNVTDPV